MLPKQWQSKFANLLGEYSPTTCVYRLILVLILVQSWTLAKGQSVIADQSSSTFYSLPKNNSFILSCAKILKVAQEKVRINTRFNKTLKLYRIDKQTLKATLYLDDPIIAGTTRYKGFDLSQFCLPDTITYNYVVRNGQLVILTQFNETRLFSAMRSGISQNFQIPITPQPIRDKLEIKHFGYTSDHISAFERMASDIDYYTYYTDLALTTQNWARRIAKATDPDSLEGWQEKISKMQNGLLKFKNVVAVNEINLTKDEALVSFNLANETTKNLQNAIAALVSKNEYSSDLLRTKADKLFHTAHRERALIYYRKLYALDPGAEQVLPRYILLSAEDGNFRESARLLVTHAPLMQGFPHHRVVDKTGRALEVSILNEVRAGRLEQALPDISLMDSLCKRFPGYRCPDLSYTTQQAPLRGDFITTLNKARSQVSLNQIDEGLAGAEQAVKIAIEGNLPYTNLQTAQTFLKQVSERKLSLLCYTAQDLFSKMLDSSGAAIMCGAAGIIAKYQISPPILYNKLKAGQLYAYVEKLLLLNTPLARAQVSTIMQSTKIKLKQQPKEIKGIDNARLAQECKRIQNLINELINKGVKAEKQLDYLEAYPYYLKAEEIRVTGTACLINNDFITQKIEASRIGFQFQKDFASFNSYLANKQFDSALIAYEKAQHVYETNNLSSNFLILPVLSKFYRNPKQTAFTLYFAKRCIMLGQADTAISLLRFAANSKANKTLLKETSDVVASALAARDYTKVPKKSPEVLAKAYISNVSKLKEFEKQYLKAWEKLK